MKKSFLIFLCLCLIIPFCTSCESNKINEDKITVVSTIFPAYDFVREIAKDKVNNILLLPPGKDSHSFDPSAKDIMNIRACKLFIYTGGESDTWVTKILSANEKNDETVVALTKLFGITHEHEHNHEYDEHVWTSPKNAKLIAEEIRNKLCEIDAENADFYNDNTTDFINRIDELDNEINTVINNSKRKIIAVADRFPLLHFVNYYGLEYISAFPGCSSKTEVSPSTLAKLIQKVEEENIPIVFKIELSDGYTANAVAKETNTQIFTFYSLHNVSKYDFENGEGYISLMKKNCDSLKIALN